MIYFSTGKAKKGCLGPKRRFLFRLLKLRKIRGKINETIWWRHLMNFYYLLISKNNFQIFRRPKVLLSCMYSFEIPLYKSDGSILFYVGLSWNLISFAKTYLQGLLTIFIARDYLARKLVSNPVLAFGKYWIDLYKNSTCSTDFFT